MSESGSSDSGTVLQRLLNERFPADDSNSISSLTDSSASNLDLRSSSQHDLHISLQSITNSTSHPSSMIDERLQPDIHSRIDALWRGTLDTPRQDASPRLSLDNDVQTPRSSKQRSSPFPPKRSAAQETLSRLRKELEQDSLSMKKSTRGTNRQLPLQNTDGTYQLGFYSGKPLEASGANSIQMSPRRRARNQARGTQRSSNHSFPFTEVDETQSTGRQLRSQLHGHPKSNSGGDEYLYTDQLHKNYQRRGIKSKKNKGEIEKSKSFRHSVEETHASPGFCQTAGLPRKNKVDTSEKWSRPVFPNNEVSKHRSSRSAPLQESGNDVILANLRRSSLHNPLNNLKEITAEDCATDPRKPADYKSSHLTEAVDGRNFLNDMHQNYQLPSFNPGPVANGSGSYARGGASPYLPGSYFSNNATPVMLQSASTPVEGGVSVMNTLGSNSPNRPPPPPYPTNYTDKDPNLGSSIDHDTWNPTRPNSLALGNSSRKKTSTGNVGTQNSPCLVSPSNSMSFITNVRNTPVYNNPNNSSHVYPVATASPHQRQTSSGNNSYSRLAPGNNVPNIPTPSSSGSSTVTAATTPAYQDPQSYSDPAVRSPPGGLRYSGVATPVLTSDIYVLNKSESVNSASSGGSGAGRIARRKRNSCSKIGFGSASCSGSSSSNSGSRPNSNADLAERLETENESLRLHLDATMQKLRKYESIEHELMKINQSHQALQQSANNRERLEKEMRNQLSAKLSQVEQDRDNYENQVLLLTERLKLTTTSSAKEIQDKENDVAGVYEAKYRKTAERERQLEEELEECRERMSEQKSDISRLTTSLQKAKSTVALLEERVLQNKHIDEYTEQLAERLLSLQHIVNERTEVELELRQQIRQQLDSQRSYKSTSPNDEGISGMDPTDPSSALSADIYNSPDKKMLGAKAEMLKWKYRYLEQGLLKHVRSTDTETNQQRSVCRALRNHRHAVSDPGFDKNPLIKYLLPDLEKQKYSSSTKLALPPTYHETSGQKLKSVSELDFQDGVTAYSSIRTAPTSKADFACQTPSTQWSLEESNTAIVGKFQRENLNKDNRLSQKKSMSSGSLVEGDLPSEGYHSQQSSGSPTPNQEKCAFSGAVDRNALSNSPKNYEVLAFRRNKSADDVLSMKV